MDIRRGLAAGLLAGLTLVPQARALPVELPPRSELGTGLNVQCRYDGGAWRATKLAAAGAWVRIDGYTDHLPLLADCITQAHRAGKRILVTLLESHAEPPDTAEYAQTIGRLAAAHPEVEAWEVWNEPNLPQFWRGGPDPARYARLLNASYDAIKRANPAALVVFGGTSFVDIPFTKAVYREGVRFDVMGVHPYEWPLTSPPGTTATGFAALPELRKLMRRHHHWQPVWLTEYGWPGGAYQAEVLALAAELRYVELALHYEWG